MPPTKAYTAHTKASSSAKEPNTSTNPPLPPPNEGVLHGAGRAGARLVARRGGGATGRGFILRRALRLHVFSHETAVRSRAAFDQRLRFIDESVGQRFAANVTYGKRLPFPLQDKIHATGKTVNAAGLNRSADAHALAQGTALESLQLRDGVVVSFAFAVSEPGKKASEKTITPMPIPNFARFCTGCLTA